MNSVASLTHRNWHNLHAFGACSPCCVSRCRSGRLTAPPSSPVDSSLHHARVWLGIFSTRAAPCERRQQAAAGAGGAESQAGHMRVERVRLIGAPDGAVSHAAVQVGMKLNLGDSSAEVQLPLCVEQRRRGR